MEKKNLTYALIKHACDTNGISMQAHHDNVCFWEEFTTKEFILDDTIFSPCKSSINSKCYMYFIREQFCHFKNTLVNPEEIDSRSIHF